MIDYCVSACLYVLDNSFYFIFWIMETRQTGKRTSDSTTTTVEDLITALSDKRVTDVLANIFENAI